MTVETTVAAENAPTNPEGFSQRHPLLGLIDNTDASVSLREFADALGILPTVQHDAVADFGIRWPAGQFTDPKSAEAIAAVRLSAAMGTRRRRALALGFQRPKTLDVAERAGRKLSEADAAACIAAWVAALTVLAEAAAVEAPKPKPQRKPRKSA
jgi:hypothetical protein